jgi:hypothetical protein
MPSAGFEPAIAAIERLQTYALDRTDTGIGPIAKMLISKFFSHGRSVAYVGKCGGNSSGVMLCKAALPVRESTDKEKGGSFH